LRRLVSEWLHETEFREHVLGFQPAHPKHGGGGAYYVRLRRSATRRP
jgi:DNA-nicking Smr family endonuclease